MRKRAHSAGSGNCKKTRPPPQTCNMDASPPSHSHSHAAEAPPACSHLPVTGCTISPPPHGWNSVAEEDAERVNGCIAALCQLKPRLIEICSERSAGTAYSVNAYDFRTGVGQTTLASLKGIDGVVDAHIVCLTDKGPALRVVVNGVREPRLLAEECAEYSATGEYRVMDKEAADNSGVLQQVLKEARRVARTIGL